MPHDMILVTHHKQITYHDHDHNRAQLPNN